MGDPGLRVLFRRMVAWLFGRISMRKIRRADWYTSNVYLWGGFAEADLISRQHASSLLRAWDEAE